VSAKLFWISAAALAMAASGAAAQPNISASKHNFTSAGWSNGEICLPCHTPHKAITGQIRLWNHELTNATYTMKSLGGSTTGTAEADLDPRSRLCLSCHDGTVALDSFGGGGNGGGATMDPNIRANLGTDLSNDHPVGSRAQYPPPNAPSWWLNSFKAVPDSGITLVTWNNGTENRNVVGCTSCHNPHKGVDPNYLLKKTNSGSQLCLGCHIK
jgi:predicted CXXCH cytochrome family protein